MEVVDILKIISIALGALSTTIIPLLISLVRSIKKRKAAQDEAEKVEAKNDMLNTLNGLITAAEQLYSDIDKVLKPQGKTTGAMKKDSVMAKLQAYATSKGYEFDEEEWSNKIDEIVKMTRKVNVKGN